VIASGWIDRVYAYKPVAILGIRVLPAFAESREQLLLVFSALPCVYESSNRWLACGTGIVLLNLRPV